MATYYVDYELGNDSNDGSAFGASTAWKTLTNGATAARIAPGDIIKIAKSPAPTALAGTTATWTNLSKTVTLNTAENLNIDMCEANWTTVNAVSATSSATDWKEGTNKVSIVCDATPTADQIQAYSATGTIAAATIDDYQGITFWIKNEVAILANQWEINLCSDTNGTTEVDTFPIPAIPSTGRWIPLTIFRNGGGNLGGGGDIQSINVSLGSAATTATASKYIYLDNIIACKTGGLNLQSLISKNSLEQGGTEARYGIQSINGTIVLLDNETNTKANAGKGYYGTTESVNTYKRETIKTNMISGGTTQSQSIVDSGTLGNNIQFQGGYDTGTGEQTGETFFDGQNGNGYGIYTNGINYTTLNFLNTIRYNYGVNYNSSSNNTITNINSSNNIHGIFFSGSCYNNTINTINNANNNGSSGIYISSDAGSCYNNTINTINNANNNINYGIYFNNTHNNNIISINSANNSYGIYFNDNSGNNILSNITTANNSNRSINILGTKNYIYNATINETTKVSGFTSFANSGIFITKLNGGYSAIYTDGGNIVSQASTLTNGSGTEWKFTTETNTNRKINYPLKLSIAKIAVVANKLVTVRLRFKKGHATNIGAKLVFSAQLGATENISTAADTTDEQELTVTFTPTEAGVAEIEARAYYINGHSTVIVDALTISQAD